MKPNKSLLCNGHPHVSCFSLSAAEAHRRRDAALAAVAQEVATYTDLSAAEQAQEREQLGREYLWHGAFEDGFLFFVCDTPLYRVGLDLEQSLPRMNGGKPLDYFDYGYLADLLREYLSQRKLAVSVGNLCRALAWVEQHGRRFYNPDLH